MKIIWNDGDYNCDKCGKLGNFNDGSMWGTGKDNPETCLCSDCLNNLTNFTIKSL